MYLLTCNVQSGNMFFTVLLYFSSALVGPVPAQQHGVQVDNVLCYRCNVLDANHFPHCLENPIRCGSGDVCRVRYGYKLPGHTPDIRCRHQRDCLHTMNGHDTPCSEGGVQIHSEYCQQCCQDDQCITDITDVLKLELIASRDLFCPHRCQVDNLKECVDNGRVCDHGDYCEIKVDHAHTVSGDCKNDHNWRHCQEGLQRVACPDDLTNKTTYSHDAVRHCYSDCCDTNECLFKRFGIHMANASFPATNQQHQTPVTSSASNQGSDLWDKLHGSCVDTFSNITCEGLKNQSDLCHSRLALGMCPKTCGICDAVQSSVCQDYETDACKERIATGGINNNSTAYCPTTEAVFSCPRTCDVCNKLLDSIVVSLLEGSSQSTNVPPSLLPPSDMSSTESYPTVNCADLHDVSCEHLVPICESTFMGTICQDECGACYNPLL